MKTLDKANVNKSSNFIGKMLLAINKHKWIIMLWHIYIWRKKRNTTKEKS